MRINFGTLLIIFIFLLAIFIRLFLIINRGPATDEIWALFLAKASFKDIWLGTLAELHAPFYFLFLHTLYLFLGSSLNIFGLRLVSLFFAILFSISLYFLTRSLFGKRLGIIALLLSLYLPSSFWISVFGRYYSLLGLLAVWALAFFIRFLTKGEVKSLIFLVLISTIGIYTHYYFLLLVFSFGLYLLLSEKNRRFFKKWCYLLICILILSLPEFIYFWFLPKPEAVGLANNLLKIPAVFLANVTSFEVILFSYYHPSVFSYLLFLAGFLIVSTVLTVGFQSWRTPLRLMFLVVLLFPPLVAFVLSYTLKPSLGVNSFLIFLPFSLIVLAKGLDFALKNQKMLTGAFLILVSLSLWLFFQSSAGIATYTQPYNFVKEKFKGGDLVLHAHAYTFVPAKYYLPEGVNFGVISTSEAPQTEKALGYKIIPPEEILVRKGRVWYFEPVFYNVKEAVAARTQLDKNFVMTQKREFTASQVNVYLYENR